MTNMLSTATVAEHLRRRGVLPDGREVSVTELSGGVSSVVLRVDSDDQSLVVKQALPKLRVRADWPAKRERTLSEAAALAAYHDITPSRVPELVDVDRDIMALTMRAAPRGVSNWKSELLADSRTALGQTPEILGDTLGQWHRSTRARVELLDEFQDDEAFDQLRVTPFHREIKRVHPHIGAALDTCIEDLTTSRECLVHGDFSPKNVLVDEDLCWIVDAEVAKAGAPVFDVAFMIAHLMLKWVHAGNPCVHRDAVDRFSSAYQARYVKVADLPHVAWHVAALLLARIDGKSPVDYLSARERHRVRRAALRLLTEREVSLDDIWNALSQEVA